MAWEDRTPAEKALVDQQAATYRDSDDDRDYLVVTGKGTRIRVHGRNSTLAVAGKDGRIFDTHGRDVTSAIATPPTPST